MQSQSTLPNVSSNGQGLESTSSLQSNLEQAGSKRIAALRQSVEQMTDLVSSQSVKAGKLVNQYVHEKPWAALGIIAALSFIAGALLTGAIGRGRSGSLE